jgi:hypothetical protein
MHVGPILVTAELFGISHASVLYWARAFSSVMLDIPQKERRLPLMERSLRLTEIQCMGSRGCGNEGAFGYKGYEREKRF